MAATVSRFCYSLQTSLSPDAIIRQDSPSYADILRIHFSIQETNVRPECFVQPSSAQEVALIINKVNAARSESNAGDAVQFAVKSGGHTAWAGSANIEHGITIDLAKLNKVHVVPDNKTTRIGPGARWSDVYDRLDSMGLAVVGGRTAQVGVGGLMLGGGLSFFSPREGFASDCVVDYEVVLANGEIVHANDSQNKNPWIALKGGSNNFGIVTQFTVLTFPQGKLWGGVNFSPIGLIDSQLDAFHQFTVNPKYDENAALIQSITFNSTRGAQGIANNMHYTLPVEKPKALEPFWNISTQRSTLRTTTLLDLTTELGAFSPNGRGEAARISLCAFLTNYCGSELYITVTFKSNPTLLKKAYYLYNDTIPGLSTIQNFFWALIFQPLPPVITGRTHKHGIDPLGLDGSPPLVLALISAAWDRDTDTPQIAATARKLIADINTVAREMGLDDYDVYLNYAHEGQDPISGYGTKNKAFLQQVSRDYDPHGLFQWGCPGGSKVFP